MHTHVSLFKGEENAFYDPKAEFNLSKIGRSFIAGILTHAAEITAVTNQWVNSYKRLHGGGEAPALVNWGPSDRGALVRLPMYKPGKENSTRIEFRSPDSACNPYLAYAVMIAAGHRAKRTGTLHTRCRTQSHRSQKEVRTGTTTGLPPYQAVQQSHPPAAAGRQQSQPEN